MAMNLLRKIFRVSKDSLSQPHQNFNEFVLKSIRLIGMNGTSDDVSIVELLKHNGVPKAEAIEILLFLPIAFCRKLLPEVHWHDDYLEQYSEDKQVNRKYADNARYVSIETITNQYWNNNPDKNIILGVAGRSAEFNAINQLLNDGGKLNDVKVTKTIILR